MVIAGEASGDQQAAAVCAELRRLHGGIEIFGMGGEEMAAAGVETVVPIGSHAVVGIWEAVRALGRFRRLFRRLEALMLERKPDAVLLVDYPGFNLRFAARARRAGIPVVYYICPQVWAWGRGRVRKIKRFVDLPLVIFGFEREFFRPYGIDAVFVGHPLADALASFPGRASARRDLGLGEETVVGLLPGSRPGEIARIYPVLLASARALAASRPGLVFITPISSPDLRCDISALASASGVPVRLVSGRAREVMVAADTVLVASGTATLETALAGTPMVVVYRVSLLSWLLALVLVKIPYISLVNIVSGRRAVPEYIQYGARPSRIAAAAARLLPGGEDRERMLEILRPVPGLLGEPGSAARAAGTVLDFLARRQPGT